jgi:putative FmdB family regulatory protein
MPIYEFECLKCHREFEELVIGEARGIRCPECRDSEVKKLMSAAAFKCDERMTTTASAGGCSGCASHSCGSCK